MSVEKQLHNDDGGLTLHGLSVLQAEINNPVWHFSVDLGINKFKKYIKTVPGFSKHMVNDQIKRYRLKAWGEYTELVDHKGSFPIHNPAYCKK